MRHCSVSINIVSTSLQRNSCLSHSGRDLVAKQVASRHHTWKISQQNELEAHALETDIRYIRVSASVAHFLLNCSLNVLTVLQTLEH